MRAVLEARYTWGPIYDWLAEIADEGVLAHPAKVWAIAEARIKTDKIDSATLAHLLRADLIPEAYAPSKESRTVKRVLRQRMVFVRVQTMMKNRIRALLSQYAVALPAVSDLFGKAGLAWLRALVDSLRGRRYQPVPRSKKGCQLYGIDPVNVCFRGADGSWAAHEAREQVAACAPRLSSESPGSARAVWWQSGAAARPPLTSAGLMGTVSPTAGLWLTTFSWTCSAH
jgi:hypothetical protein